MPDPTDHKKIPETVPPLTLPDFDYDDLKKGDRIGTGGDADVYRATVEHERYTYTVAVKEPRFEGTIQKRVFEKFKKEAETWSGLDDHDNIVSVYVWGTDPLPWLGLEYMDGGSLESRIGDVGLAEGLWLAGRIAEGIRYGHRHGVAHLDIKPTNVLLRDTGAGTWDYPKVSDWGLAKMLLEHSNSVEGISPTYAAPEQFDSETFGKADDFTDIYQLGTVVYALLAGEPPFTGPSTAVMRSVLDDEPEPPSAVNSELSDAFDDVVLKALAKQKDNRYESIVVFRKELDRLFKEAMEDGRLTPGSRTNKSDETGGSQQAPTDSGRGFGTNEGVSTSTPSMGTARSHGETEEPSQLSGTSSVQSETGSPTQSSTQDTSGGNGTPLVTRRRTLGVLGIGAVGIGGSWMATQMGGDDDTNPNTGAGGDPTETEEQIEDDEPTEEEAPGGEPSDGLVAYWPLDELSATITDRSNNGNSGRIVDYGENEITQTNGVSGEALDFSNTNDHIEVSSTERLSGGSSTKITITAWIKPSEDLEDGGVVSKQQGGHSGDWGMHVGDHINSTQVVNDVAENPPYIFYYSEAADSVQIYANQLRYDEWQHATITFSQPEGRVQIYLSGELVVNYTGLGRISSNTDAPVGIGAMADYGDRSSEVGDTPFYSGAIDEVRIYDRVLSSEEINNLMRADRS